MNTNIPSDADLHAEDNFSYTPVVLAAEAGSRESDGQAFESLMKFIGLLWNLLVSYEIYWILVYIHDVNKNPLFQALKTGDKALPAVKVSSKLHTWESFGMCHTQL